MLAPLVLSAAVFAIVGFVEARAPELPAGFEPYVNRADGTRADPVNLIFRGTNADGVAAAIAKVMGWRFVRGSPMTFQSHGADYPTAWQMGIELDGSSRMHIRIQTAASESEPGFVLAAVHRDDTVACGHVGRAFDESRDQVARAFAAAGHRVSQLRLGNVLAGRHCDGSENASDGNVIIIDLNEKQ